MRQRRQHKRRRLCPAAEQAGSSAAEQPEPKEDVDSQILAIALPTLATLAADPLASLVSAWYARGCSSAGQLFRCSWRCSWIPVLTCAIW